MGKIDDMRRLREQQHAAREGQAAPAKKKALEARAATPAGEAAGAETGECESCGKRKALVNAVIANHQKGFGKMCPGSRQKPRGA
jgi:hypothetical protein